MDSAAIGLRGAFVLSPIADQSVPARWQERSLADCGKDDAAQSFQAAVVWPERPAIAEALHDVPLDSEFAVVAIQVASMKDGSGRVVPNI